MQTILLVIWAAVFIVKLLALHEGREPSAAQRQQARWRSGRARQGFGPRV